MCLLQKVDSCGWSEDVSISEALSKMNAGGNDQSMVSECYCLFWPTITNINYTTPQLMYASSFAVAKNTIVNNTTFSSFTTNLTNVFAPNSLEDILDGPFKDAKRRLNFLRLLAQSTESSHIDNTKIQLSIKHTTDLIDRFQAELEKQSNFQKCLEIQHSLIQTGLTQNQILETLANSERSFVKEGDMLKASRKKNIGYRFWLFNDCLLYGSKYAGTAKFEFHRCLNLDSVQVRKGADETSFEIISKEKSFSVLCTYGFERDEWVAELSGCIMSSRSAAGLPEIGAVVAAPLWKSDQNNKNCTLCAKAFTTFRNRKHHCRKCGDVVCGDCSRSKIVLQELYGLVPVRVCDDCMNGKKSFTVSTAVGGGGERGRGANTKNANTDTTESSYSTESSTTSSNMKQLMTKKSSILNKTGSVGGFGPGRMQTFGTTTFDTSVDGGTRDSVETDFFSHKNPDVDSEANTNTVTVAPPRISSVPRKVGVGGEQQQQQQKEASIVSSDPIMAQLASSKLNQEKEREEEEKEEREREEEAREIEARAIEAKEIEEKEKKEGEKREKEKKEREEKEREEKEREEKEREEKEREEKEREEKEREEKEKEEKEKEAEQLFSKFRAENESELLAEKERMRLSNLKLKKRMEMEMEEEREKMRQDAAKERQELSEAEESRIAREKLIKEEVETMKKKLQEEMDNERKRLKKELEKERRELRTAAEGVPKYSQSNPPPPPPRKKKVRVDVEVEAEAETETVERPQAVLALSDGDLMGSIKAGVSLKKRGGVPSSQHRKPPLSPLLAQIASGATTLKKIDVNSSSKKADHKDNSLMGALSRAMEGRRIGIEDDSDDEDGNGNGNGRGRGGGSKVGSVYVNDSDSEDEWSD